MDKIKYFKDLFESIPENRKIVIILFWLIMIMIFSIECGFLETDFNRLYSKFKNILIEQNET